MRRAKIAMHKDDRKIKEDSAKHIREGSNCGAKRMFSLSSTYVLKQWYSGEYLTTHDLILLVRLKPCNALKSDSDFGPNLMFALRGTSYIRSSCQ